jgi:ABC-type transport system involved in multi-copper enzyme maturation permease subunit
MDVEVNGHWMFMHIASDVHNLGVMASIFTAFFIGSEFSTRTFGICIIRGCSRSALFMSKTLVFLIGLTMISLAYLVSGVLGATAINGFGEFTPDIRVHLIQTTLLLFPSYWALGGLCILFAMWIKNIAGIISTGVGYALIIPAILEIIAPMRFSFTYQMMHIAQPESIALFIGVCSVTLIATLLVSAVIFEKAELK